MGVRWAKMVGDLETLEAARVEGFQGVQLGVGRLLEQSERRLAEIASLLARLGLSVDACGGPLPPEVRVTERGFNTYVWIEYLKGVVERIASLGCRTLLWSDGYARYLPEEGDVSDMKQQMLQFVAMICDVAGKRDITVMIEPLGARRTNYLNTLQETVDFIEAAGRSNVASVISLGELSTIGAEMTDLALFARYIGHVQADAPRAEGGAQASPRPSDGYDYAPFFRSLRAIGYRGAIALPEDSDAESLRFCREVWARE